MKDKSKRVEQIKLSCVNAKEAATVWNRIKNSIKNSKPSSNDRFKRT